jgi:hypothetical protein
MIFEDIEFLQKGLKHPRVFIKGVFSNVKFKFVRDACVNLANANFWNLLVGCLHEQVHLILKIKIYGESSPNFLGAGRTSSGKRVCFTLYIIYI